MSQNAEEFALRLQDVSRAFGQTPAVSGISLDIRRGEVVSLVGHSGCGKSTLLRIVAGVETADGGQFFLGNRQDRKSTRLNSSH